MSSTTGQTPQILLYRDMLVLATAYRRTRNTTSSGFSIDTKGCTAIARHAKRIQVTLPQITYFEGHHTSYQISGELQALLRDEVCEAIRSELDRRVDMELVEASELESIVSECLETLMGRKYDEKMMEAYMEDDVRQKQVSDPEGRVYTVVRGS